MPHPGKSISQTSGMRTIRHSVELLASLHSDSQSFLIERNYTYSLCCGDGDTESRVVPEERERGKLKDLFPLLCCIESNLPVEHHRVSRPDDEMNRND